MTIVGIEQIPETFRQAAAQAAVNYREQLGLAADAPVEILAWQVVPPLGFTHEGTEVMPEHATFFLAQPDTFVRENHGQLDLGIVRSDDDRRRNRIRLRVERFVRRHL